MSDPRNGDGYRRVVRTAGGDAVVFSSRGSAKVLDVTPKSGWTAAVRQEAMELASVTFVQQSQRSRSTRVTVGWATPNGPIAEVAETRVIPSG